MAKLKPGQFEGYVYVWDSPYEDVIVSASKSKLSVFTRVESLPRDLDLSHLPEIWFDHERRTVGRVLSFTKDDVGIKILAELNYEQDYLARIAAHGIANKSLRGLSFGYYRDRVPLKTDRVIENKQAGVVEISLCVSPKCEKAFVTDFEPIPQVYSSLLDLDRSQMSGTLNTRV